jgi:biotin operon repressor
MEILRQTELFERIALLIRTGAACSTEQLAEKLNVSRRQAKTYIRVMRRLGHPISYRRKTGYQYVSNSEIKNG